MGQHEPLLDLSTMIERPRIRIDGVAYEIRTPEELTLFQSQQFTLWGKELEALGAAPEKADELEALVRRVVTAVTVEVPPAVLGKLSTSQLMNIVEVFIGLLLGRRLRLAGALAAQVVSRSTGAKSSPGSSTPSAASPAGGSPAPRPLS
jgi:hypothetical protein